MSAVTKTAPRTGHVLSNLRHTLALSSYGSWHTAGSISGDEIICTAICSTFARAEFSLGMLAIAKAAIAEHCSVSSAPRA